MAEPTLPIAKPDQNLKLDDLPPEILGTIFNMVIRDYWVQIFNDVFTIEALMEMLFGTDLRDPRFNPLEPARACAALFTAAPREVKMVTFVRIPPELLRPNVILRKSRTEAKLLRTMVNLQVPINFDGKEGYPIDAKKHETRVKAAIESLRHLKDTTPHLLHLHIYIMTPGYIYLRPRGGVLRNFFRPKATDHQDDKRAMESGLARIIETVRELKIKTVDLSFDERDQDHFVEEGGDVEAESFAKEMVRHGSEGWDCVWRVQGGNPVRREPHEGGE